LIAVQLDQKIIKIPLFHGKKRAIGGKSTLQLTTNKTKIQIFKKGVG